MRLFLALWLVLAGWASAVTADQVDRLTKAMHLSDVMQILRDEGVAQGRELDKSLLDGEGGSFFEAQVEDLYDKAWMQAKIHDALAGGMSEGQLEQAALFFESDLGRAVVSLENSARRTFSEEAIEEMAMAAYREADRDAAYFRLIDEYVEINDLVDRNVRGALQADYNFFRGLADGQGITGDDGEMLAQLLAQGAQSEQQTREWLYSFLLFAYQPLSEAQLRENIAFSRTEAGQALNDALFAGLDTMFNELSYQLGVTVAQVLQASDL
ncbi:DUF2059 domain-containing protein [Ruegeria arenilitoris]|uniref:DUF2059 domain-containing protein n=1 Tax=Ruegeria arenilitoris TaxID=1173585 RepID=UPI00147D033E|nr:DUF2059 domain-containing protein [Ruegeria arenilitoris]